MSFSSAAATMPPTHISDYELILNTEISPGHLFVGIPSDLADFQWSECVARLEPDHLEIISPTGASIRLENAEDLFNHPLPKIYGAIDIEAQEIHTLCAGAGGQA